MEQHLVQSIWDCNPNDVINGERSRHLYQETTTRGCFLILSILTI